MILSKTCDYAMRAAFYIADQQDRNFVPIREVSEKLEISFHFLTKILQILTQKKIMTSFKGPNGGVTLARPADSILLTEIVKAIDDECRESKERQFLTQAISKRLNEFRSENEAISDRVVNNRIRRLGFHKKRFNNGRMGFRINMEKLRCLKNKYQIGDKTEPSEASEG